MSNATILLVDDEKPILISLKQQLRNSFGERFSYETAENVSEAWDVIAELEDEGVRIVVVVSDWLMPETRGDEFLGELRRRHPQIGRIMLTGHANEDAIERAHQEAQVHGVLAKPWKLAELQAVIEAALAD